MAISSLVDMSGYLFRLKVCSSSCSCCDVKWVLWRRCLLFFLSFLVSVSADTIESPSWPIPTGVTTSVLIEASFSVRLLPEFGEEEKHTWCCRVNDGYWISLGRMDGWMKKAGLYRGWHMLLWANIHVKWSDNNIAPCNSMQPKPLQKIMRSFDLHADKIIDWW